MAKDIAVPEPDIGLVSRLVQVLIEGLVPPERAEEAFTIAIAIETAAATEARRHYREGYEAAATDLATAARPKKGLLATLDEFMMTSGLDVELKAGKAKLH